MASKWDSGVIHEYPQLHYEVVKFSVSRNDYWRDGKLIHAAGDWHYPSERSWGTRGFTVDTYDRAVDLAKRRNLADTIQKARRDELKTRLEDETKETEDLIEEEKYLNEEVFFGEEPEDEDEEFDC
jgi:hypothetical protein